MPPPSLPGAPIREDTREKGAKMYPGVLFRGGGPFSSGTVNTKYYTTHQKLVNMNFYYFFTSHAKL